MCTGLHVFYLVDKQTGEMEVTVLEIILSSLNHRLSKDISKINKVGSLVATFKQA